MADDKYIQALYEQLSSKLELGDVGQFKTMLSSDDKFRKAIYDQASIDLDLGDYGSFENEVKKKSSPIELASEGQTVLQEFGLSPKESLTPQQPLPSAEKPRETSVMGDLARTIKSSSLRALGGVTEFPLFVDQTIHALVSKPIIKALGGTDEEAEQFADYTRSLSTFGQTMQAGDDAQNMLNEKAAKTEAKMHQIEGNIVQNIQQGNWGKALELLGRGTAGSIPYLAMTAATAGGGTAAVLGTIGATAAAQQYGELDEVEEPQRLLNSWMYGGFEAAGELVTAGLLRGIGKTFVNAKVTPKKVDPEAAKGFAKGLLKSFGLEGSSEAATQVGQNFTDIVTGVNPNIGIFDNVLDAAMIGGVAGGGIGVANVGASMLGRAMASTKEVEQVQNNVKQQEVLINQIEQTDSDPAKEALKRSIKDLKVQANEVMDANYELATKLSPEKQAQVAELYSVWNELQGKIDNNEVTAQEIPALENTIKGIKDQIQGIKDDLVTQLEEEAKAKESGEPVKKETTTEPTEAVAEPTIEQTETPVEKPQKAPYVEINSENISEIENNELTSLREQGATEEELASAQENINLIKEYIDELQRPNREEGTGGEGVLRTEGQENIGGITEAETGGDVSAYPTVLAGRRELNRAAKLTPEEQVTQRLAPTGEKSNLSDKNFDLVRTPEFKQRFGDWQKGEGSLVLDRNGEPMVVYHGAPQIYTEGVDPQKTASKKSYFTGNKEAARVYARFRNKQPVIYEGFLVVNESDLGQGNQIDKLPGFEDTHQEYLTTRKEQFIPTKITKVEKVKKGKKAETAQSKDSTIPLVTDKKVEDFSGLSAQERSGVMFAKALPDIMNKAFAEQKPFKEAFLKRKGLTEEGFNELSQEKKDKLQDEWVSSPEFKELQDKNEGLTEGISEGIPPQESVQKPAEPTYGTKKTLPKNTAKRFDEVTLKPNAKKSIPNVPKTEVQTLADGSRVMEVDGAFIRDNIHADFTMGGNEGAYPAYVPQGEIWIDKDMNPKDKEATILHEATEKRLMLEEGLTYENAHDKANKVESKFRETGEKPKEITESKEAITAPITEDQGRVPPTPQKPVKEAEMTSEGETRTREIGAKVIESANVAQDVKDALLENGIDYIPRGRKFTQTEAKEIVDAFATNEDGLGRLSKAVFDLKNDIKGDTRITLNVYIADKYSKLLDESKDPKEREKYRNKLADAFIFGQEFATEAGQTVEALKRWRELLSRDPESIIAIRKRQQSKTNEFALAGMESDIKSAKEILDSIVNTEEFKQFVESEVNKEIDKIANKKYGEVDKKKINDFFDGLLVKNDKAFDATVGIPIAVYNGAVLVIKKAVLAGVDVTNAIKQAVDYIDAWYQKNYADGKISSPEWNRDDYMAQMDKQLQPLTRKVKKVKRKVSKKVEESLVDKIYAKMSTATKPQLRRLVREYITTLDAEGAISEQRFKDLFAQAIGLDVLTPENEQKIRETALSLKNATKAAEKLVAKFKELVDETDNTKLKQLEEEIKVLKKEANKAKFEAQKAARKLEGLMTDKATLGSTIHTIIQGNLLTPISLMSNVVGNTVFLPVRNASYMVASALDLVLSKMASVYTPVLNDPWVKANPRVRRLIESLPTPSREYDYFASVRGYWYGMPKGLEEGIRQMWTGTLPESEYQQYIGQGLNPWKAALRLRDQLTGKEQIAFDTAMANLLEAFPTTYMAEGFFRALNLGDKPYRRAAERSRLEEIASLKGLKGKQRDAFINNPDPDSVEEARKEGDVAVYQQDTVVSEMFSWLNKRINRVAAQKATKRTSVIISTVGALLKATQAPYVKTPVNLIGEAIDYSIPSLSLFRALYYAKEGNKRKSYEYFGKAAVGYMLMNITFFLIKEGLLSPPTDDDDKIRQAQYDAKPGYSLNIDALWRRIDPFDNAKGNSEWKDKDKIVNVQRLGVFSMILMGQSKAYSEFPPDEMREDMNFIDKSGYGMRMIPSVVGASLDQSFLSGTASGIKAFTEGGPAFDRWVISTSKALSAVIYPNTLAQISQVFFDDNYIREVKDMYSRDEKFKKQIINTFRDRTFMGKDLPAKITLWGEKVNRVPEGESWAHVMFDVTRSVEYQKSSFGVRMFEWWERYRFIDETEARKILPSIPSGSNTVGWDDRNMTAKEVEEFQMAVGQRRKSYVENTMNSVEWEEMSDEERIVELERIYRTQASKVKAGMFMLDVIKADPKVFNFLDENDLIPIPTKTVTIKYQRQSTKLDPEQTAEYYSNVQRYFVERINNSGIADRELSEDERSKEKLIKQVNGHWDRAREVASKNWITSQRK